MREGEGEGERGRGGEGGRKEVCQLKWQTSCLSLPSPVTLSWQLSPVLSAPSSAPSVPPSEARATHHSLLTSSPTIHTCPPPSPPLLLPPFPSPTCCFCTSHTLCPAGIVSARNGLLISFSGPSIASPMDSVGDSLPVCRVSVNGFSWIML